jgi:lysozyme
MTKLEEQLINDEGFMSKPYKDTVGKVTIGYGRNLDDVGISRSEAYAMLQNDIIKVRSELLVKIPFFKNLTDGRQNALINMAFNMGTGGLLKFVNTLKLIEQKNYIQASIELLNSKWAKQVGFRAERIANQIKNGF